jgi:sterol-4alpha-carboxylate 3-dehydrogenase (decarboxylating)
MDLYNMPAAAPPPGVISNFDDPPSLKGELLVINVVFTTFMAIFVAIRLVSRGFISKQIGADDCKLPQPM